MTMNTIRNYPHTCAVDTSCIAYISTDHDAIQEAYDSLKFVAQASGISTDDILSMSMVRVEKDCRIPDVFHGDDKFAAILTYININSDIPTYDLTIITK